MKPGEIDGAKARMLQRYGVYLKAHEGFGIINPLMQSAIPKGVDAKLLDDQIVQDNRLYIEGVITQDAAMLRDYYDTMAISTADVRKALSKMSGDIEMWVNSSGGEIAEASAMSVEVRTYAEKGNNVLCVVTGRAASAATFLLLTSDKVAMFESATLFIHEPWACACGTSEKLQQASEQLEVQKSQVAKLYSKKSGKSEEEMLEIMKGDTQINAAEAVEMNFADELREMVIPSNANDPENMNKKDDIRQELLRQGMAFNWMLGVS